MEEVSRVPWSVLGRVSLVAIGVQFGWSLQLSLLTPYIQLLGIPHAWASSIWLCGPISGLLIQPLVGLYSDRCRSPWGRRRPFIAAGASFIAAAFLVIAFSADFGYLLGDDLTSRPRAALVFVLGFWILDLANNIYQGPCRALLADLTGEDYLQSCHANAIFTLCSAFGNVLGFAAGAYSSWYQVFPFTLTTACSNSCANLKSAFLIAVILLITTTLLSMSAISEMPWSSIAISQNSSATVPLLHQKPPIEKKGGGQDVGKKDDAETRDVQRQASLWELCSAIKGLPRPIYRVLLVTAATWFAWTPFLLYDTDWMGREVFMGNPSSTDASLVKLYDAGVRAGSFGLMLASIVLGITSLLIEPICRRVGQTKVWTLGNLIISACLCGTVIITIESKQACKALGYVPASVVGSALGIFAILGVPVAVVYSLPYAAMTMVTNTAGGGQGLSMGMLNLGTMVPQVVVAMGIGFWDELFGGGNMPAFILAAVIALGAGILAFLFLPNPSSNVRGSPV